MVETFQNAISHVAPAKIGSPARLAIVWAQYGPYHLARLRKLKATCTPEQVVGIEIANKTATYAWQRSDAERVGIITLVPDVPAERVSTLAVYRAALSTFRRQRIDVVFAPSYWPASSLAVIIAARTAGCRVVMMNDSHALTAKAKGLLAWVKRRLVLQFDAALVAGTLQKKYFTGMGMVPERIVMGYDAVDNEHFSLGAAAARADAAAVRAKHGLPTRYFLSVGRMVKKKNLASLVSAYQQVRVRLGADCPALVFVGNGKLEDSLRIQCQSLGLSVHQAGPTTTTRPGNADVYFFGFRQVNDLPDFYALAECFILPSREEEWGLVVNEAMASGLAVIVSRVAGCARDLVHEGQNGFLFEPLDVATLAGHLEAFARDPSLKEKMGQASQQLISGWGCERFAAAAREAAALALR